MKDKKQKKQRLVKFDHSKESLFFSDIAEVNVANEAVSISFATMNLDGKDAKVSHTVYLTTPHFIRLAEICHNLSNNIISDLNKSVEELKKSK